MDGASNGPFAKFQHPQITAAGEARASVALTDPETLWFNSIVGKCKEQVTQRRA